MINTVLSLETGTSNPIRPHGRLSSITKFTVNVVCVREESKQQIHRPQPVMSFLCSVILIKTNVIMSLLKGTVNR